MRTAKATPIDEQPERRQTLALILVTALGYLPLVRYLSWQITAFLALVLGLRLAAVRWPEATPGRFALLALTAVGGLNCWHAYQGLPGRAGGAALFVTMLGLKLLELRAKRDYRVVAMLLGFLVMVQFLFDRSGVLTVYLAAVTLAAVMLLVDLNGGFGVSGWRIPLRLSARLGLEALPVAIALFILFPRLESPLWSLGVEREAGVVGMSDRLELGSISELVITAELAFRARFDRGAPPASRLYWRGLVLWSAGESGWSPGLYPQSQPDGEGLASAGERLDYELVLEPSGKRWVFALDLPTEHPRDTVLSADFQLLADRPIEAPKRFRMRSALEYRTRDSPEPLRQLALQLPANVTQRMRDLVAGWRRGGSGDWAVVQAALDFFHREPFAYTLSPPPPGSNPTDSFLFETRSGYCEHYANSFALLMRIAGIPSRIVLGYLGGELNAIGGYYMVWQSDAQDRLRPSLSALPNLPRIFNALEFFRGRVGHYISETSARGSISVVSVLPGRWGTPRAL
jgi:transglutaminase-like putative cysteine protease